MASRNLYPPVVDSYMSAFQYNTPCRVYFRLSKFNGANDVSSVHASIVKQDTGINVVNMKNEDALTGIIINLPIHLVSEDDDLYYIEISKDYLSCTMDRKDPNLGEYKTYQGWIPGWIYKIQLRLSSVKYIPSKDGDQAVWLNNNSNFFSEWSTICIVKATGEIGYKIDGLKINTKDENSKPLSMVREINTSTLDLSGRVYRDVDSSELIKTYRFILYDENDKILEDSGEIYANQYQDNNSFNYVLKTELVSGDQLKVAFIITTVNNYIDGFYYIDEEHDNRCQINCDILSSTSTKCRLISLENDARTDNFQWYMADIVGTSKDKEEDEGRVAIKMYSPDESIVSGNFCIRRSDSRTNFQVWTDVYLYVCKQEVINETPVFYDYTIESGVWYKYGVQEIDINGERTSLQIIGTPIMRNFNYSFLLGKNNRQLRLEFDNTMTNFKYQLSESKSDPIGSQYPNISKNAMTYYKVFPLNGLISFWMDEDNLFTSKKELYDVKGRAGTSSVDSITDLYNAYNDKNNIQQYDYIYERFFRDKVLEFLQDGEPKLFKSPTEGNIIIRLMEVTCTPNQSVDRMIYSFSSNANELDEFNLENCLKYEFYKINPYATNFATTLTKLGQLTGEFAPGTDLIQEIFNKYDSGARNIAGYRHTIKSIHHIKITFDGKPLRIVRKVKDENGNTITKLVLGNYFNFKNEDFIVHHPNRIYEFDGRMKLTKTDNLIVYGTGEENDNTKVSVTVDFLYDVENDIYIGKRIAVQELKHGLGQIYKTCTPGENLFRDISYRNYIEWESHFKRLVSLSSIDIEANPGAVFNIQDTSDGSTQHLHMVGITGRLNLFEIENITAIEYLGIRNAQGIIEEKDTDVLLDYYSIIREGTYQTRSSS